MTDINCCRLTVSCHMIILIISTLLKVQDDHRSIFRIILITSGRKYIYTSIILQSSFEGGIIQTKFDILPQTSILPLKIHSISLCVPYLVAI